MYFEYLELWLKLNCNRIDCNIGGQGDLWVEASSFTMTDATDTSDTNDTNDTNDTFHMKALSFPSSTQIYMRTIFSIN